MCASPTSGQSSLGGVSQAFPQVLRTCRGRRTPPSLLPATQWGTHHKGIGAWRRVRDTVTRYHKETGGPLPAGTTFSSSTPLGEGHPLPEDRDLGIATVNPGPSPSWGKKPTTRFGWGNLEDPQAATPLYKRDPPPLPEVHDWRTERTGASTTGMTEWQKTASYTPAQHKEGRHESFS